MSKRAYILSPPYSSATGQNFTTLRHGLEARGYEVSEMEIPGEALQLEALIRSAAVVLYAPAAMGCVYRGRSATWRRIVEKYAGMTIFIRFNDLLDDEAYLCMTNPEKLLQDLDLISGIQEQRNERK